MPALYTRPEDGSEFACPECTTRLVFRTKFHLMKAVALIGLFPAIILIRYVDGIGWPVALFVLFGGGAFIYFAHASERLESL
jgi:hypothetical protein